jgi:acyl carrier protein
MKVTPEVVVQEIQRVASSELKLGRDLLPSDRLVEDLGLDSVTLVELAVELEDTFHVLLSDEAAAGLETVGQLAECVALRLTQQEAAPADVSPSEVAQAGADERVANRVPPSSAPVAP